MYYVLKGWKYFFQSLRGKEDIVKKNSKDYICVRIFKNKDGKKINNEILFEEF